MVRRIMIILSSLIILAGFFSGCHSQVIEQASIAPATEHEQETQLTALPSPALEDIVIPAISKTYAWDDGVGNRNRVTIRAPHINSSNSFAVAYNKQIDSYVDEIIQEVEACAYGAFSTHIFSVDYSAFLNGNLLSVLITTKMDADYTEYRIDNFDLDSGKALTAADLCDKFFGMDYPVFLKYAYDWIWEEFEAKHADFIVQFPEEFEYLRSLYASDLSMLCRYGLYLNEAGRPILVADQPSVASAAYYPQLQELHADPAFVLEKEKSWNWLFELYLGAEPDHIEYARKLLVTAFESNQDAFTQYLKTRSQQDQDILENAIDTHYNSKG